MRKAYCQGHKLLGLAAGVAEHHALIAGAVVKLGISAFLGFKRLVNAEGYIRRLLVDIGDDAAGVAVKAVLGSVIADISDNAACYLRNVDIALGAYLTHDVDKAGGNGRLACDAAVGVLLEDSVKDSVRYLVADLIGMSLGYRFRCKQSFAHFFFLRKLYFRTRIRQLKNSVDRRSNKFGHKPHLSIITAGFGTLPSQVAGLHRAVPSTTLDKVFSFRMNYSRLTHIVK